jgi:hypothetical protein
LAAADLDGVILTHSTRRPLDAAPAHRRRWARHQGVIMSNLQRASVGAYHFTDIYPEFPNLTVQYQYEDK